MDHPITLNDRLKASIELEAERRRKNLAAFLGITEEANRDRCDGCGEYSINCTCEEADNVDQNA